MADLTFTDSNFETDVRKSDVPVVVDVWAPWCGPCRLVTPIIEDLAREYEGKVKVGKLNADENPNVVGEFGIMSIPTVMIFKNGQPVKSLVGAQGKETYKRNIDEALAS
jgi:thioredoxin 1